MVKGDVTRLRQLDHGADDAGGRAGHGDRGARQRPRRRGGDGRASPSWSRASSMKPERKRDGAVRRGRLRAERVFDGLGVSPGIAIGPAHVVEAGFIDVPEYDDRRRRGGGRAAALRRRPRQVAAPAEEAQGQVRGAPRHRRRGARLPARCPPADADRLARACAASSSASPSSASTPRPPCARRSRRSRRASPSSTTPISPPAPTTSARSATA